VRPAEVRPCRKTLPTCAEATRSWLDRCGAEVLTPTITIWPTSSSTVQPSSGSAAVVADGVTVEEALVEGVGPVGEPLGPLEPPVLDGAGVPVGDVSVPTEHAARALASTSETRPSRRERTVSSCPGRA
jgi:hypothetical protein